MGRAKLTSDDKQEIQRLFKGGVGIPALATSYGVSYVTIKRVVNPEFYAKHLADSAKYSKENASQIYRQKKKTFREYSFKLHREKDASIIQVLDGKENVSQYIRDLIVSDIES